MKVVTGSILSLLGAKCELLANDPWF